MRKTVLKSTVLDRVGKELGEVRIYAAYRGLCGAEAIAQNGEALSIVNFNKVNGKWQNDYSPTRCTNKERLTVAVNRLFSTSEYMRFLAERSGYESHSL